MLDAEPNPFERSFSGTDPNAAAAATAGTSASATRRARSISPNSLVPRATPGGTKLAPLALMNSPGQDLTEFGWGSDSLRTGPLSPALLNGPAGGQPGMYNMRNTGLTPMGGGNNGHGGVSFPPPSPATAALFAMMTNNTPGVSDANAPGMGGGGPRPHEGPNEANNFEASFAQAAHDHHQNQQNVQQGSIPSHLQHQQPHLQQLPHYQSAPALINGMHRQQLASQLGSQAGRSMAPQSMLPDHPGGPQRQLPPQQQGGYYGQQPPQNDPYGQPNTYGHYGNNGQPPQLAQHNSAYAALPSGAPGQTQPSQQPAPPGGNQNPLYLLSQASGHTDDAVVAAAALSGLGGSAFGGSPPGGAPPMQAGLNGMNGGSNNANNAGSSHSSASSTAQNNVPATRSAPKRGAAGGAGKRKKSEMANDQNYGEDVKPPVAKKGKRQSKPTAKAIQGGGLGGGGGSSVGGDDASLDGMPEMSMSPEATGNKPNETEDEKRKNFLERNRQGKFLSSSLQRRSSGSEQLLIIYTSLNFSCAQMSTTQEGMACQLAVQGRDAHDRQRHVAANGDQPEGRDSKSASHFTSSRQLPGGQHGAGSAQLCSTACCHWRECSAILSAKTSALEGSITTKTLEGMHSRFA